MHRKNGEIVDVEYDEFDEKRGKEARERVPSLDEDLFSAHLQ